MVDRKIISYVRNQLEDGYTVAQIKSNLIKNGYKPSVATEAINRSMQQPSFFTPVNLIIILSVFILIVLLGSMYFFFQDNEVNVPMSLSIRCSKISVSKGDSLSCVNRLEGPEQKSAIEFVQRVELINKKSNKVSPVYEESEIVTIPATFNSDINIPSDIESGEYFVRIILPISGKKLIGTTQVKINELIVDNVIPDIEEEIPVIDIEENFEIEEPLPEVEEEIEEPVDEYIEEEESYLFDDLEEIKQLAVNDHFSAARKCPTLQFQLSIDKCYSIVAKESGNSRYCENIEDDRTKDGCYSDVALKLFDSSMCDSIEMDNRRDNCYMSFVTGDKKDYTVCDKVINEYLKESCIYLREFSNVDPEELALFKENVLNQNIEYI